MTDVLMICAVILLLVLAGALPTFLSFRKWRREADAAFDKWQNDAEAAFNADSLIPQPPGRNVSPGTDADGGAGGVA